MAKRRHEITLTMLDKKKKKKKAVAAGENALIFVSFEALVLVFCWGV